MLWEYDGSFDGLLCAVAAALKNGDMEAQIQCQGSGSLSLFDSKQVVRDFAKSEKLANWLRRHCGQNSLRKIMHVYLSEVTGLENLIFNYIRLSIEQKRNIDGWHSNENVRRFLECQRKVGHEIHRFSGLLRFEELEDKSLYAPFEPDHNIVLCLAKFFTVRMKTEKWMIHDCKRDIGVFWNGSELLPATAQGELKNSDEEKVFQDCWRRYHREIAIKERRKITLQRQFMPVRYWKYLTEMKG